MPPVVAFIQSGFAFIFSAGATGSALAAVVVGTTAIAAASKLLKPKINFSVDDNDRSRQTTVRSTTEPRKLIYGETMVSGPLTYAQVSGANNKYLHQVVALAGHELTQISKVFLDDKSIDLTNASIYNSGSKSVISGFFGPKNNESGVSETVVYIDTRLGTSSQTAYSGLRADSTTSTEYLATHRGDNVASLYTRWTINEGSREVWDEVGSVQNIKALVKGKKIYDPRLEVDAGGTAGASPTNASYVVYDDNSLSTGAIDRGEQGRNPALMIADYLMDSEFGLGIPSSKIDWAAIIAAADDCDTLVPIPNSATQKRFFGSGVIFGADPYAKSIEKILSGMNGSLVYSQGKYIVRAGVFFAPTESITEDDIIGAVDIRTAIPRSDRLNQIKGLFIDPTEQYKMMEFGPVTVSGAIARDNGETLEEEIKLPFTDNRYAAQRIAFKQVNQSFLQTMITVPVNLKGMRIAVGDRVNVYLSDLESVDAGEWNPKIFKCINWSFAENGSGGINLTLLEDAEARYADPSATGGPNNSGDYSTITAQGVIARNLPDVPAPTNFGITAAINSIELTWDNPSNALAWEQIWVFRNTTGTTPTDSDTPIVKFRGTSYTDQRAADGTEYYYWIQAVRYPQGSTPSSGANASKSVMVASTPVKIAATKIGNAVMGTNSIDTAQIIDSAVGSEQIATTIQSDNWSVQEETGWQINRSGSATFQNAVVRGNVTATTGTIGGFTVGSTDLIAGDETTRVSLSTSDGISLGDNTFADAPFRVTRAGALTATNATITGAITATSGNIANSVTIGGTAASTVESGAAAGATASQVNKGLALLLNQEADGSSNVGEAGLVGVDKNGNPETGTDGFIIYNGDKITVERSQYADITILTNVANKRGFICFDANKTDVFRTTSYGDLNVAFVWKEGDQWYYDDNASGVSFTPSSIIGQVNGTDGTTTPILLAIGFLETSTSDLILTGGLFEPIALETAPFAGDTYNSGTIGGININTSSIYSGSHSTYSSNAQGFFIGSNGTMSFGDGTQQTLTFDTGGNLTITGAVNATSGDFSGQVAVGSTAGTITVIDGNDTDYRMFTNASLDTETGQYFPDDSSFKVGNDGRVFASNITIYNTDGDVLLSPSGLGAAALNDISVSSGSVVSTVGGTVSNSTSEITLTTATASESFTITSKVAIDDNSDLTQYFAGASTSSVANAEAQLTGVDVLVDYYVKPDGGSYSGTPSATQRVTIINSGTPSATQIRVGGFDRGASYGGSLTRYYAIPQDFGGALEIITNSGSGSSKYVVTTASLGSSLFPTAQTYKIKIVVRVVEDGTTTIISGSTTPPSSNNTTTGIYFDGGNSDERHYELTGSGLIKSSDNVFISGSQNLLSSGGTISGNLVVTGDLTVQGTTTTVDTDNLTVKDNNITLNYATGDSSSTANNAGITIQDAVDASTDASILWKTATDSFEFSHPVNPLTVNSSLNLRSAGGEAGIYLQDSSASNATAFKIYADVTLETSTLFIDYDPDGTGAGWSFVNNGNFLASGTIYADGAASNSLQWETGYDYSQIGHLPLAGGTLTGGLTVEPSTVTSAVVSSYAALVAEATEGQIQVIAADSGSWASNIVLSNYTASTRRHYWLHNSPSTSGVNGGKFELRTSDTVTADQIGGQGSGSTVLLVVDNSGNSTFSGTISSGAITSTGKVSAATNYVYGSTNYHFVMNEDNGASYIGNINGSAIISSGGYYYGADLRQLNSGVQNYSALNLTQTGKIIFEQIVGATAGSAVNRTVPFEIDTSGNSKHRGYSSWVSGSEISGIFMHYNATSDYRGYFDWRTLQLGNNGANNILAGNTGTGGFFQFYTNATAISQSGGTSGNLALTLEADADAVFGGNLYIPEYLYHTGNTGNNLRFTTDKAVITAAHTAVTAGAANNQKFEVGSSSSTTPVGFLFETVNKDGNAASDKSLRMFMSETGYNGSTGYQYLYGFSLVYEGSGSAPLDFDSGFTSTLGNGEWGMYGHENSVDGVLIVHSNRAGTFYNIKISGTNALAINSSRNATFAGTVTSGDITATSNLFLRSSGGEAGIYLQDSSASNATAWKIYADVTLSTSTLFISYDPAGSGAGWSFTNNGNFLAAGTVYADGAASNSTQWKTGYDYSQIGHLPLAGGTLTGALTASGGLLLNNTNITGVNALSFNDPGPNEGISWTSGNTAIFESPDNLTTNSAGNLQFVYGGTRRLTVNNAGIDVNGQITAKSAVLTDDGSGTPLLRISADDSSPWALQLYREDLSGGPQVYASDATTFSFQGHLDIRSGYSLKFASNTVIDSARNITAANGMLATGIWINNNQPSENNAVFSGYGVIGNRGTFYITNGGGVVQIGNGNIHNSNASATFSTTYLSLGANRAFQMNGTEIISASRNLNNLGNIRTTSDNAYLSMGVPGLGTSAGARYLSIEGNTDTSGEGSGRIFFTEHNSTTGSMDGYGMSLGYRGGDTSIVGASGNTWTGLTQIGNGEWGMWGHDNSNAGALIMAGPRSGSNTRFYGNASWVSGNGIAGIFMRYTSTSSYQGYFDWRTLQLGNNGANNILAGNTSAGGYFDFYVNATSISQSGGTSGIKALTLTAAGNTIARYDFTASGNVTAYSDERLKENIQTLDGSKVLQMRGVSFTKDGKEGSGVIAQELELIASELVHTADDEIGTKSVAYGNLVGYLIENAKQQQAEIDELKALVKKLMEK